MRKKVIRMIKKHERGVTVGMAIMLVGLVGCATETPKASSPISPDQVREHSERAFDKLKQEEQNRAVGSALDP
jgi:hypothetical protein